MLSELDASRAYMAHKARRQRLQRQRVREPVNSYPPSISVAEGVSTIAPGGWTGSPVFAYQWFVNGAMAAGETAATYELQEGDDTISCRVTASNVGGEMVAFAPAVEIN
jgi:hypothetical protein